jgi:hypothetical protein
VPATEAHIPAGGLKSHSMPLQTRPRQHQQSPQLMLVQLTDRFDQFRIERHLGDAESNEEVAVAPPPPVLEGPADRSRAAVTVGGAQFDGSRLDRSYEIVEEDGPSFVVER